MSSLVKIGLTALLVSSLSACQSAYYAAWEKVGVEKREILVDRVEDARESQEDAEEQFSSALEEFSALIQFDGGDLEEVYQSLNDEYEASQEAAEDVSKRIDKIESVAGALFEEWEAELDTYSNESLKRTSKRQLAETRVKYNKMVRAMRKVESSMQPVLRTLQDNVLFLKHNLNASAIGALQGELNDIERDVRDLLRDMKSAISQSNAFIADMNGG
ncbi:DUF2959 domain-containing protein [Alteromonas lipolytica]|uniref:DNA repair protein n=1 Tax=Alteromonas lipolytica TaxID=1856405 RepID=A0A1E8F9N1_9ALTE|nr:DUF2959 domain-containing protein [Alteromonas lipolytica]OFI32328.1 DNA repair protein [Alteromonas lipolytica]GGF85410.1 DNA repair ATPase [Alteromonas lipolytica]